MTQPLPPCWRVAFRRAGDPMTLYDTLVIVGPANIVTALKEAQKMLVAKDGGPWLVQGIEERAEDAAAPEPARIGDAFDRARNPFP